MSEWGVSPDYIVRNWSEERLRSMVESLNRRKKLEAKAMSAGKGKGKKPGGADRSPVKMTREEAADLRRERG